MSYRARWDLTGNPKSLKQYRYASGDAPAIGDLMWYDRRGVSGVAGGCARPFSSTSAWTGSTAGSQAKVAEAFLGVCQSVDTVNLLCSITGRGVVGMPTDTPYTFDVGDLIVPVKDPSGNLLYSQVVAKGTVTGPQDFNSLSREIAIGKAHKRYAAVSGVVEFEICGIHESGAGPRQFLTS